MQRVLTHVRPVRGVREISVDRRVIFGGVAASLIGLAARSKDAAAEVRRGECKGCRTNQGCRKRLRCVQGRCVPRTIELVCGGAYQDCQNGRLPECVDGVATCPGHKPADPYCG